MTSETDQDEQSVVLDMEAIAVLHKMFGTRFDLVFPKLVQKFKTHIPELLAQIGAATQDQKQEMYRAAHTIKGGSAQMGAARLLRVALLLEQLVVEPGAADLGGTLAQARQEHERAVAALEKLLP